MVIGGLAIAPQFEVEFIRAIAIRNSPRRLSVIARG